ncbi:hypothetical protein FACS1894208_05120 [Clostridia bacterium]|nr:hypothetical protein FACS1894208_05120 [Clostridia bacterium]
MESNRKAQLAALVIIIVLLLPVLIFNAIPHFLFGFPGNNSTDVLDMTAKALSVGNIYDHFDDVSKREMDKLIAKLTETASATSIMTDVRNTNLAWLIAITSVQYNQDLAVMDEDTILDMISKKLKYTIENVGNKRKISITDMSPSEYMDALHFTPEQRDWAELLFSTMTDNQNVTPDYADYEETATLDGFVYYNQRDSRWADVLYGRSGTIGQAGCGPTALAIAVSNLTGRTVTPAQVADWSYRNGYRVEGSGSSQALIPDGAKHYGLRVEGVGLNSGKVRSALESGKLVIAIMSAGHFTSGGHFIVLRGVTEDGGILVADPASVKRTSQVWDLELIAAEANRSMAVGGPFWILG